MGDILLVEDNDTFPADMVLLKSSNGENAFIQTSSLDREKNYKKRLLPNNFEELVKPFDEQDFHLVGKTVVEAPTLDLYSFNGKMIIGSEQFALKVKQLLLKGSNLKNTQWVLGLVVYTGKATKIMLNSQKSRTKRSHVEKILNVIIFLILSVQLLTCFVLCIIMTIDDAIDDSYQDYYLGAGNSNENPFLNFFSYFLLLNTMIPISLVVTLEIIKVLQCFAIVWDSKMFSVENNAGCHVSMSTINEELGQVKYVFSDKTGTLTQNMMEFKALCVETEIYGNIGEQLKRKASRLEMAMEVEYTFKSHKLDSLLEDQKNTDGDSLKINSTNGRTSYTLQNNREKAAEAIKLLAVCHECVPETVELDGESFTFFQGPSPDESTLVDFAQKQGFEFSETSETH